MPRKIIPSEFDSLLGDGCGDHGVGFAGETQIARACHTLHRQPTRIGADFPGLDLERIIQHNIHHLYSIERITQAEALGPVLHHQNRPHYDAPGVLS